VLSPTSSHAGSMRIVAVGEEAGHRKEQATLQLILDNGVEEYILEPDADDLDVLVKLFARSEHTTFDLERKVLMFSNLSVE
jgi:hypothetical protein